MQDIRKPYSRSRSNRDISARIEQFEKRSYLLNKNEEDESPKRDGARGGRDIEKHIDDFDYKKTKAKPSYGKSNFGTYFFIFFVIALVSFVGLYTYVFNSATITFVPKSEDANVSKSFVLSTEKAPGSIYFEIATTTITKTKSLPLSEARKVEMKASGKIIVYNNFDSAPQKLIKNTRFESAAGKIYRINDSIIVPGKKGSTPGSIEVTVYADSYGADYNTDPTDFTIPGFKNSPRYKAFFGRSNGKISGGANGNVSLVSDSDLNSAKDELALELGKEVRDQMKDVKKDGFSPLYDNIQVVFSDNTDELKVGADSTYKVVATGYLILVSNDDLAKAMASTLRDYSSENVKLTYTDTLKFSLKDQTDLSKDTQIPVLIEGTPRVLWVTNEDRLRELLAGKGRDSFASIMKGITSVEKAEINFSPLWLSTFPTKQSAIKFIENQPKR